MFNPNERGVIPVGGTQPMTRLIGEWKAMEHILTGDMISAEEATQLRFVNQVLAPEDFESKTMELANKTALSRSATISSMSC
jgi:enoyl-CoA hydratase